MSCPICDKNSDPKFKPFCSKRCADLDLGKWLNGSYSIPAPLEDLSEEEEMAVIHAVETRH